EAPPPEEEEIVTYVYNADTEPPTGDPALCTDTTSHQMIKDTNT
ncbi:unnamed protein product, partial [marine sediment metagenome]